MLKIRALVLAIALCLALTATASAATLHLRPTEQLQTWHSSHRFDSNHALRFAVYVHGKDITARGNLASKCRWTMFTRRLSLELASCGRGRVPVRVSYVGTVPFTFTYGAIVAAPNRKEF